MKYTALFACLFLCSEAKPQAGFLDSTFGEFGIATSPTGGTTNICLDHNNGFILGGHADYMGNTGYAIRRHLPDGPLDVSFGENGFSILSDGEFHDGFVTSAAALPDNKIITCGYSQTMVLLARFKENGQLDSTFATNGMATASFKLRVGIHCMQVQSNGKYVLAGNNIDKDENLDIVVLRFNSDGSLDNSFGKDGQVIISQFFARIANAILLQPDGKIIIGGNSDEGSNKIFLARLNNNGSLDNTFSNDGIIVTDLPGKQETINSLALQPDGKIIAGGFSYTGDEISDEAMTVLRYNDNGHLDNDFGKNGYVTIKFSNNLASTGNTVLVQSDGKIIVTGEVSNPFEHYFDAALVRLKEDGIVDSSFSVNGRQITNIGGSDAAEAAILQPDQKIVISDFAYIDAQNFYCALARYNNDIVMPLHFTYFNAAPINNSSIILNWQTAQENNNNNFSIERTASNNFNEIARINSKGNSSQAQTYSYTDNAPLQGTNFYRLKQVDKDGKFSYSQIVSAILQDGLTVVLYPNPVKDVLNIKGLDAGMSYELSVMSAKGSLVAQTSINNISSYSWNLQSLSKGIYYLTCRQAGINIVSNQSSTTVKFVKE